MNMYSESLKLHNLFLKYKLPYLIDSVDNRYLRVISKSDKNRYYAIFSKLSPNDLNSRSKFELEIYRENIIKELEDINHGTLKSLFKRLIDKLLCDKI